jgi:hypothetical protein
MSKLDFNVDKTVVNLKGVPLRITYSVLKIFISSHRWSRITSLMFVSNEFFNSQGAFMKYLLVLKSFSIRQSKELLFRFGINVDSEIDCLSMIGIIQLI